MSLSLRRRIFLGTTVTLAGVVLVGSVAVWLGARALLYGGLDRDLHDRVRDLSAMFSGQRRPPGDGRGPPSSQPPPSPRLGDQGRPPPRPGDQDRPPPWGQPRGVPPEFRADGGAMMMEIVDASGAQLVHSPSVPEGVSLWSLLPAPPIPGRISAAHLPDGRSLRLLSQPMPVNPGRPSLPPWLGPPGDPSPGGDTSRTVVLAIDATAAESDLTRLGWALAVLWGLAPAWRRWSHSGCTVRCCDR